MNPEVSIVLPFYNREWSLKRALDSILNQSFSNWELILIDDGSTDGSFALANAYKNQHSNKILCIQTKNKGVSAARNLGIQLSSGKTIAFLDSDDEWKPQKLERHLHFHKSNAYLISQTTEEWHREGKQVKIPKHLRKKADNIFEFSLNTCAITPSSLMIDRTLLEVVGIFDEALPSCEDYDLWLRITPFYNVGLLEEDLLIRYGGHEDQLSSKYPIMDTFRLKSLHKLLLHPHLAKSKKEQVQKVIEKKFFIVMNGAEKRNNQLVIDEFSATYPELARLWRQSPR